jgi:hypothetical protein
MVTAMTDVSEALDFLENVFGNRDRHLVAIEAGGNPKKIVGRFFDPHDSGVASWVSGHNQKYGIYYTVNELSDQFQGSKPTKGDVAKARFLHVDIDSEDGFERLAAFEPNPTCVMMSGGGYQGLWRLKEPSENLVAIEAINKKLAAALGGDSCIDRLLRLPGTMNLPDERKRARGREPTAAYLVDDLTDWELAYAAKDFAHLPDPKEEGPKGNGHADSESAFDLAKLPPRLRNTIKLGRYEDYASRSEAVFAAACGLVRENIADDDIVAVLLAPTYKISEHVLDQPNPAAYARRQARNARDKAGARAYDNGKAKAANPPPETRNAKTLRDKVFDPIKFIVKGYVVEGATILAGRPKIGKSWLVLDWALATARGGFCFGACIVKKARFYSSR